MHKNHAETQAGKEKTRRPHGSHTDLLSLYAAAQYLTPSGITGAAAGGNNAEIGGIMTTEYIWPFWLGGLAIAAVSVTLVVTTGKFISVTRGYASVCSIFSKLKFFQRPDLGGPFGFRTVFTIGLLAGGAIAAATTVGWQGTFALGKFDQIWGSSLVTKGLILTAGGFLWGYGSRMAKGCTSGNSIAGLSKGSLASLVATCGFLVAGVIVTFAVAQISGVK